VAGVQRRRRVVRQLASLAALTVVMPVRAAAQGSIEAMILVRSSPLAGFQFHAGDDLWSQMQVGDRLTLIREPGNPHDRNAIRVDWRTIKLGYVPRRDNPQVARQMDLGAPLEARISRLREARNPWDRIEFEVVLVLPRREIVPEVSRERTAPTQAPGLSAAPP
jgi:hypothetical protein